MACYSALSPFVGLLDPAAHDHPDKERRSIGGLTGKRYLCLISLRKPTTVTKFFSIQLMSTVLNDFMASAQKGLERCGAHV